MSKTIFDLGANITPIDNDVVYSTTSLRSAMGMTQAAFEDIAKNNAAVAAAMNDLATKMRAILDAQIIAALGIPASAFGPENTTAPAAKAEAVDTARINFDDVL